MWDFKPNEVNMIPKDPINNNSKYVKNHAIITPRVLEPILKNNVFPKLLEVYPLIPKWVIKTDLGRLLVIYFNGGIYADTDCFIQKPLTVHKENHKVILFVEKVCNSINELGHRECKNPENVVRIANYCFGSKVKKHPFFKEVIEECFNRLNKLLIIERRTELSHADILWVCGPDAITTVYHNVRQRYNDIYLYDKDYLNHTSTGSWR